MFYHLDPNRRGERLARVLERTDGYRVLRRLPRADEFWCRSMPVPGRCLKIGVIDCETNGLDPERHRMIEVAIGTLTIDLDLGDVVGVTSPQSWLEDPGEDLPIEIEQLTHITSKMLVGAAFPDAEIEHALREVGALVAHNAGFDRGFVTRRFPAAATLPWACSMSEIDWPAQGLGSNRGLGSLVTAAGFFLPDAHRAAADVWATTSLLASIAHDGRSTAAHLVEVAMRPTHRLYAERSPFGCKDALKAAGYRWSAKRRAWWIEGEPERIANETAWLRQLSSAICPTITEICWTNRHAQ